MAEQAAGWTGNCLAGQSPALGHAEKQSRATTGCGADAALGVGFVQVGEHTTCR